MDNFYIYSKSILETTVADNTDVFTLGVATPFDTAGPYSHLFCGLDQLQFPTGQNRIAVSINDFNSGSADIDIDPYKLADFSAGSAVVAADTYLISFGCLVLRSK